jgi:hypothetical protein
MAAYPTHATRTPKRNYPPSRAGNALMAASANRPGLRCEWCAAKLHGRQTRFCCPAHRSSMSRRKHASAVQALAQIGIPKHQAVAVVARYGLPAVEDKLNALGWYYYGRLKAWYFDGVETSRRAA